MPIIKLKEKAKADKEIERITKNTRLQTLKTLVPPELFHRSDLYEQELERVYSWKGLSDDDIKDIYQAKLRNIDLGRARATKQHSASIGAGGFHNVFSNFRDVPQFCEMASSASLQANKTNTERIRNLMKRIASNGSEFILITSCRPSAISWRTNEGEAAKTFCW